MILASISTNLHSKFLRITKSQVTICHVFYTPFLRFIYVLGGRDNRMTEPPLREKFNCMKVPFGTLYNFSYS